MQNNESAELSVTAPKSKFKKLLVYSPWLISGFYLLLNSGIWVYEQFSDIPIDHNFYIKEQMFVQVSEHMENEQATKNILRLSQSNVTLKDCARSEGLKNKLKSVFSKKMMAGIMTLEIKHEDEQKDDSITLLRTANCYVNHNPPTGPIFKNIDDFHNYTVIFKYLQTREPYSKRPIWSLLKLFDKSVEVDENTWEGFPESTEKYDTNIWVLKDSGPISLEANKKYDIKVPLNVGDIKYVLTYVAPRTNEDTNNTPALDTESTSIAIHPNPSEKLNTNILSNDAQSGPIQVCRNWVDTELKCSVRWFIRQWYDGVDDNQKYSGKLYENISVQNVTSFGNSPSFLKGSSVNNYENLEMNILRTSSTPLIRDTNDSVEDSNNDNRWHDMEWIDRNDQPWVKISTKLRDHNNNNTDAFYNIYFMVKNPNNCRSSFNDKVTNYEFVDGCLIKKISFEQISAVN